MKNPYPGLRPFEEGESDLFFGRESQTDELLRRLGRSRFVAVVGTSGSGKSSLVRAGLLPALRGGSLVAAGSHWRIAVLRPGGDPINSLGLALHVSLYSNSIQDHYVREMLETTLCRSSLGIVEAVRQARLDPHENLLIVVDQFEELFRFRPVGARWTPRDSAAGFVHRLLDAVRQRNIRIYVLITMRSDFLGDCAQFRDLSEVINDGLYLIPRMTRDQLRLAIKAPAAVDGVGMTPRLVQELLNDVNDDPDQLPVLQHALMRTWHEWQNKLGGPMPIDLEDYKAIGSMAEALSRHADEAWEQLSDDAPSCKKQLAKKLFQCLTEKGPDNREMRRPTRLLDLCRILGTDEDVVRTVVEHYREEDRAFLMPPCHMVLDENSFIDISHESLIRKWDRLRGWVEEEAQSAAIYRRVAEAARLETCGEAGLWRDPQLQLALDWRAKIKPSRAWAERYDPKFEVSIDFLDRSVQEREAQARREKEVILREEEAMRRQEEAFRKEEEARLRAEKASLSAEKARLTAEEANRKRKEAERWRKLIYCILSVTILVAAVLGWLNRQNLKLLQDDIASRLATNSSLLINQKASAVELSLLLATESMKRKATVQNDEALRVELGLLPREISHAPHPHERINEVAFSPDGLYVATAGAVVNGEGGPDGGMARIIRVKDGQEISVKYKSEIRTIAFSGDSQYLATASANLASVIESATGKQISELKHDDTVKAIAFSPDNRYVATASADRTARVMVAATGRQVTKLIHDGEVNTVAYSPDGQHVVTGSDDHTIRFIQAAKGLVVWTFQENLAVKRVTFSRDGSLVAAAGGGENDSGFVHVLTTLGGSSKFRTTQKSNITAVALSPEGSYVATGSQDYTARLFRLDTGMEEWHLLHQGTVKSVAFSSDGHHFATGSGDQTVRVFEVATGSEITRLPHQASVTSVAFSPDGKQVASGTLDGTVRIMESSASKELRHLPGSNEVLATAFSPDHRYVATGGASGVRVTELETGKEISQFQHDAKVKVYALAFSSNSRFLATVSSDNTARISDLVTGSEIGSPLHAGSVSAIAFSPEIGLVVVGVHDQIRLIEPIKGTDIAIASIPKPASIRALAAQLTRIAVGGDDNVVHIYDMKGMELSSPQSCGSQINILLFSPDGRYLSVASGDTVCLIPLARLKETKLRSYPEWISSLGFSADSQAMAVGGFQGMIRVISTANDEEKSALSHGETVYDLAFSTVAGRQSLLVLTRDTVYQDLLRPVDLIDSACLRLSRNLTREEWQSFIPEVGYRKTCENLP
jgi:WD40 repeat protein